MTPASAVRLRPRSVLAIAVVSVGGLLAFGWPLIIDPGSGIAHARRAAVRFEIGANVLDLFSVAQAALAIGIVEAFGARDA